jgi:hypothetical protein
VGFKLQEIGRHFFCDALFRLLPKYLYERNLKKLFFWQFFLKKIKIANSGLPPFRKFDKWTKFGLVKILAMWL